MVGIFVCKRMSRAINGAYKPHGSFIKDYLTVQGWEENYR